MKRIAFLMMMLFAGFTFNACNNDDNNDSINTIDYGVTNPSIYSYPQLDRNGNLSYYGVYVSGTIHNYTDKDVKGFVLYTFSNFTIRTLNYVIKANSEFRYSYDFLDGYKLSGTQADEVNSKIYNTENVMFNVVE